MPSRTENLKSQINQARQKIVQLFKEQCEQGSQSELLKNYNCLACGQFLNVLEKSQRGIHGTVAALSTLAVNNLHKDTINKLTNYLVDREATESKIDNNKGVPEGKCKLDYENVIKISECIIALTKLDSSISQGRLKEDLIRKLISHPIQDKGWGYFIGDSEIEKLPTAFAMVALSQTNNKEISDKSLEYLKNNLISSYVNTERYKNLSLIDMSIDAFCLYAITFREGFNNIPEPSGDLGTVFRKILQLQKKSILNVMEQNVEYYHKGEKTCYIKVPFDLYIIALSSHYDFRRIFSSQIVQTRLNDILNQVLNSGFNYPHAGKMISARSNAVLSEVLSIINHNLANQTLSRCQIVLDWLAAKWRSKLITVLLRVLFAVTIVVIFISYTQDNSGRLHDLGTEITGILLGLFFTLNIQRWFKRD